MEKQQAYEKLIVKGIKGLPHELLAEIADFVYFVRKRVTQPQAYEAELETVLLAPELAPPTNGETTQTDDADRDWLNLAGTISLDDLQLMTEAIEAGCERVDLDEW